MITRREAITGIGVLTLAAYARQSAAAARTSKVAVSGGSATYVATKNLVAQDFSPEDAAEALKRDGSRWRLIDWSLRGS